VSSSPTALAKFESYGPRTRKVALAHFGKSIKEIESILGKRKPDPDVRDDLAWALWHYARGKAGLDGSLADRLSDLRRSVELLGKTARLFHDMLARGHYAEDAAASTIAVMLNAAGLDVEELLEQLKVVLSVTGGVDASKDMGGRSSDNESKVLMDRVADIFPAGDRTTGGCHLGPSQGYFCRQVFQGRRTGGHCCRVCPADATAN
jgi:hypothetical protein